MLKILKRLQTFSRNKKESESVVSLSKAPLAYRIMRPSRKGAIGVQLSGGAMFVNQGWRRGGIGIRSSVVSYRSVKGHTGSNPVASSFKNLNFGNPALGKDNGVSGNHSLCRLQIPILLYRQFPLLSRKIVELLACKDLERQAKNEYAQNGEKVSGFIFSCGRQ